MLLPSLALLSASPAGGAGFDPHRLWTAQGAEAGAGFGSAVAAGDVNGDGFRDVIVGAPHASTTAGAPDGKVFAYYGSAGDLPSTPSWTAEGEQGVNPSSRFGSSLASADVNGDGFDDLVVGAWGFDSPDGLPFRGAGRIYVYYGSAQGLPPAPAFVADGHGYDHGLITGLGYTLATGDFNGDGFADVAASNYAKYLGGAAVYYGSASGLSQSGSWSFTGGPFHFLGSSVSVGDFDGDGYDDLIVTNKVDQTSAFKDQWAALIYRGSPTGFPPVGYPPTAPHAAFTFTDWTTAASIGDVDGDGYDDILALELEYDGCFCNAPTYVLRRGSPSGPGRRRELAPSLDDPFPVLYPIGDLNGDGFGDSVAVESQLYLVHFGSASGLDPLSNGTGRVPAGPFAAAGDFNGDRIGDLIVGNSSNERADLYGGGTDWSFSATADLAIEQIAFDAFGQGFDLTVMNQGPDPVRLRLFDPVPPTLSNATWFCYHVPHGPPSGATASCLHLPVPTGEIDSVITIAPGGAILYESWGSVVSLPVVNTAYLVLSEWLVDPDLSNNRTTAVLGPPLQLLFRDDFESGDLSAWSSHGARGLEVTHEASLQGAYGLAVTRRGLGSAIVRDDSPAGESDYHAHFLFDPVGFGPQGPVGVAILFGAHAESSPVPRFEVRLESGGGPPALRARATLDDGTVRESAPIPITPARHLLELAWRRSSGPTANDGQLQLRLDGAAGAHLVSLDNDAGGGVDDVELGLASAGVPPGGIPRTVLLDGFVSWRPD